jgi:hypothetical protein
MKGFIHGFVWSGARKFVRRLAIGSLLPLAACASFDGQPRPVVARPVSIPQGYEVHTALEKFYSTSDANEQKGYRDTVIAIYMRTADDRYREFRGALSRETKGANFGLGLGVLGLTTGATVAAERTAHFLSAGAAALSGAQGALSKEVYFEKTLPALLAGMEASRLRIKTQILVRMQEAASSYSLSEAFMDLDRYEAAASLDSAIEMVTAEASQRRAIEQSRFDTEMLFVSGVPDDGVPDVRFDIRTKLAAAIADPAALARAAKAVNVDVPPGQPARQTILAITRKFAAETDAAKTKTMADAVEAALKGN